MRGKKLDVLVLVILAVAGIVYSYLTKDLYIGRATIAGSVYIIPSIIDLSLRKKKNWPKVIVSTLFLGGILGFLFEFFQEFNNSYSVISTLFSFKILGVLPIDNVIGHMLMTMLTIVFYEHFVDREVHHSISKNFKFAILPALFMFAVIISLFFLRPESLIVRYPYFYMGVAAIIPTLFLGITRPRFIKNMLETAVYFFFFYFAIELVAVINNWWIYRGDNYTGWIDFFGVKFPFEELFFWMMFYAASLVAYYELFIDDHSKTVSVIKRR